MPSSGITASRSAEDARKLAALDRYAAETREAVYRGFEAIDTERRALELSRVQVEVRQTESLGKLRSIDTQLPNNPLYFQIPNRVEPRMPAHALASPERRDRMGDLHRDRLEANFPQRFVDSDSEWHFDSLRGLLKPERTDAGADAFTIKEILGHGSIQTSARYVHATDEGKRRAVESLASYSSQKVCHKIVTNEERRFL